MKIRSLCLSAALVISSLSLFAQTPQQSAAKVTTLAESVNEFERLRQQRQNVVARASANSVEQTPISRDWEIDSFHLVNKSRALTTGQSNGKKLAASQRAKLEREVVEHAIRLVAVDARSGNEDRELETTTAVLNVLTALVTETQPAVVK